MSTLNTCVAMPELWQIAIGVVVVVIALREMADAKLGEIALVVVVGFAMPAFTHNYSYMGVAILVSIVLVYLMRWFVTRART